MYKYTYDFFGISEIKQILFNFIDQPATNNILEIGCYEGLSSVYFADNLLNNNNSTLICVDPFNNILNNDHKDLLTGDQEKNFDNNISICKNTSKITVYKITSDEFFINNTKLFNFIYIDGCHESEFITRDMENSFKFLEKNGIMWMDDYLGGTGGIKNTMDMFLHKYYGQYDLIHKGYQIAIRKK